MKILLRGSWFHSPILYTVSVTFLGCMQQATQRAEPAGPISQPASVIDSTSRLASQLLDIYQPGIAQYDYRSISTIQLLANDSTSRTDSTQVTAILTATFAAVSGRQTIEATLKADSILIVTQPLSASASSFQTQFIPLQIDRMTGRSLSPRPIVAECNQATVDFIFRGDEVIPAIRYNSTGTRFWTDSIVSEICRGGMRIQSTRVGRYRIDSSTSSTTPTTQLIRTTDIRMSGAGAQWQQPVQVSGEGISIDTLVITGAPPRLQQLSGTSRLSLEFKSPMRTQQFVQTTTASTIKRTP
jgi:hypothetical protein